MILDTITHIIIGNFCGDIISSIYYKYRLLLERTALGISTSFSYFTVYLTHPSQHTLLRVLTKTNLVA